MVDEIPEMTPSADELWRDLCEKDDRTSPEDYPKMALITQNELTSIFDTGRATERAALRKALTEPSDYITEIAERAMDGALPNQYKHLSPVVACAVLRAVADALLPEGER